MFYIGVGPVSGDWRETGAAQWGWAVRDGVVRSAAKGCGTVRSAAEGGGAARSATGGGGGAARRALGGDDAVRLAQVSSADSVPRRNRVSGVVIWDQSG
jgi:hypothetical protein